MGTISILRKKGFTLLEILLVIAAIGILASIVIVAINPQRQLAQVRDTQRISDLEAMYKGLNQYLIDYGQYPAPIQSMAIGYEERREVCRQAVSNSGCISLSGDITPTYLAQIPQDPQANVSDQISEWGTGYSVVRNSDGTIALVANIPEIESSLVYGVILDPSSALLLPQSITDLTVNIVNSDDAQLSWSVPESPEPVIDYRVIYSTSNFASQTIIPDVVSTSYTVTDLPSGVYQFKVLARSSIGFGPDSNIVSSTVCLADCTDHSGSDLIISSNQTVQGVHLNIGTFQVNTGVTATLNQGVPYKVFADTVIVDGTISAAGRGFAGARTPTNSSTTGAGPGGGSGTTSNNTTPLSGGGHGARGGTSSSGVLGGVAYGSVTQPSTQGSGGGASSSSSVYAGGNGGGVIQIYSQGDVSIDGSVSADGLQTAQAWGGGGAGGSVWITANGQLQGSGSIRAVGGNGSPSNSAGSGAGGRIALYYGEKTHTGDVLVSGGSGASSGTIFEKNTQSDSSVLTLRNSTLPSIVTAINQDSLSGVEVNALVLENVNIQFSGVDLSGLSEMVSTGSTIQAIQSDFSNITSLTSTNSSLRFESDSDLSSLDEISLNQSQLSISRQNTLFTQLSSLTLSNGSILRQYQNTVNSRGEYLDLEVGSLEIDATSRIDVSGLGYLGGRSGANTGTTGYGPGGGSGTSINYTNRLSGGGHGGVGASSSYGVAGGGSYGSVTEPIELGSGGGASSSNSGYSGGNGGGAIRLRVTGNAVVNGGIWANGASTTSAWGGGGAGGSIWMQVDGTLSGNGTIRANGASGSDTGSAGAGAGGRVALYYGQKTYSGQITAFGGVGYGAGGVGTVYQRDETANEDSLIFNNNTSTPLAGLTAVTDSQLDGTNLALVSILNNSNVQLNNISFGQTNTVTILNSRATLNNTSLPTVSNMNVTGSFVWLDGSTDISGISTLTVSGSQMSLRQSVSKSTNMDLTLSNGSILRQYQNTVNSRGEYLDLEVGSLEIDATSRIDVSGLGYLGGRSGANTGTTGYGPGGGSGTSINYTNRLSGGGHGGVGASSSYGVAGGGSYGSVTEPIELGSGGGASSSNSGYSGGNGGGAIRLRVTGNAVVNGGIWANGASTTSAWGGGGAGGSIWMQVDGTLSGNGTIRANGASGSDTGSAGAGAGGRVALYTGSNTFSGTTTVNGGVGYGTGGVGTIYQE
jgi:prepilin-type N-terminal cleavage/methylation domain-containing protein